MTDDDRKDELGKVLFCIEHYIQVYECKAECTQGEESMRNYSAVEALVHLKNHLLKRADSVYYAHEVKKD